MSAHRIPTPYTMGAGLFWLLYVPLGVAVDASVDVMDFPFGKIRWVCIGEFRNRFSVGASS